jgi:hypothetical protein
VSTVLEEEAGWPAMPDDPAEVHETDIDWLAEIQRDDREIEDELAEYAAMMEYCYGDRYKAARWMRGDRDDD